MFFLSPTTHIIKRQVVRPFLDWGGSCCCCTKCSSENWKKTSLWSLRLAVIKTITLWRYDRYVLTYTVTYSHVSPRLSTGTVERWSCSFLADSVIVVNGRKRYERTSLFRRPVSRSLTHFVSVDTLLWINIVSFLRAF